MNRPTNPREIYIAAAARRFAADGYHGTSLATLKRRLRAEGKSYRSIVDEVRMVLAYEYLVMSPMVIKEAAYLLHYDNPGNFCRAFRRWFGTTPEAFRQSPVGGG